VERSEPSDAWDDAGDDPRDDGHVQPAPLPAHERSWRHPSEVGQATWMLTEPPVAIGRGLLVTTGAIGCVLGIAVLWLLVPVGGGLAPTAAPTVTSSFSALLPVVTTSDEAPVSTDVRIQTTVAFQQPSITLPSEDVPLNTVLVTRPATPENNAVAVAVAIGGVPFIVTTANAVSNTEGFSLVGNGDPADGSIVAMNGDLAYLSSTATIDVVGFSETGSAAAGDMVMVLGQEQTPVHFVDHGAIVELDASLVREGTPVIDEAGALVALCTVVDGSEGSYVALVPIAPPPVVDPVESTTTSSTSVPDTSSSTSVPDTTVPAATSTPTAWAGIRFGDVDGAAVPTVVSVIAASPAATGGLQPGDHIVAVDGAPVTQVDEVLAAIRAKVPGASIVFKVVASPAIGSGTGSGTGTTTTSLVPVERTVSVVLGVYEPAV
jgi:putative serine protease PepD